MKKCIASLGFILVFTGYALFQNGAGQTPVSADSVTASSATQTTTTNTTTASAPPPKKTVAAAGTSATSQGQYRDGTYTGSSANAYYGYVQVRVTITNGRIADVAFLNYPQDRGTSRNINSYAMPQLTQEAIAAQSASVNGVSGASDTSAAFRQSLSSALTQAA